ncbi:MAG: ribonuclease P protein component [Chitinophagaceae bacterium]
MTGKLTLGKDERLKSRKATELLFKEGERFTVPPFRICYISPGGKGLQFGVGVSAKNFKRAVDRNRIKRLTREAWRLQKKGLQTALEEKQKALQIFLIYTGKEISDYEIVFKKMTMILTKLLSLVNENTASHS